MNSTPELKIYKAGDGWRWRAVARNGKIIASGEAYRNRADVLRTLRKLFSITHVDIEGLVVVRL